MTFSQTKQFVSSALDFLPERANIFFGRGFNLEIFSELKFPLNN